MPGSTVTDSKDTNLTLCSPRQSSGLNPQNVVLISTARPSDVPLNHVLIRVDRFGFSANNITYQALGEHPHFRYFDFHFTPETNEVKKATHGLIPVWGFGTIVQSRHPKIQAGERIYGYLAPARYLLVPVSPSDVNKFAFYIPRPHLPADRRPYNQILRCATDPHYIPTESAEDLTMLYRPLFWTSYWCEDWLHTSGYRGGVTHIILSSASSKTAFCLAYLIRKRISRGELDSKFKIIGLTSPRNTTFTKSLNLYHDVLDYDSFTSTELIRSGQHFRWIYIDVAGNDDLNNRIFTHFASARTGEVVTSISLGLTNLSPSSPDVKWNSDMKISGTKTSDDSVGDPDTPKMEQFFMPEWLDVRRRQIPINEIFARQNTAWKEFMTDCVDWVKIERTYGGSAVQRAYERLSKDGLGPDKGLVWSLWNQEETNVASKL